MLPEQFPEIHYNYCEYKNDGENFVTNIVFGRKPLNANLIFEDITNFSYFNEDT